MIHAELSSRVSAAVVVAAVIGSVSTWQRSAGASESETSAPLPVQNSPARRAVESDRRQDGAETSDRETRVIPLGAVGFLELKTVSGDITVIAGNGRDVHLEIVRRARARTSDDAQRALAAATVVVDHQGGRASVTTVYRGDRRMAGRVEVALIATVPAGTRLSATSLAGNLLVRNVKGEVEAALTSGSIQLVNAGHVSSARTISGDITLSDVTSRAGLKVATVSGSIIADRIEADHVELDAATGTIVARNVSANRVTSRTLSGAIEYEGRFVRGGRYEFQSHSGKVQVTGRGSGFILQASSFSGTIQPSATLALKAVTASPQSLRATVGDGSATVAITTFSGHIAIARR